MRRIVRRKLDKKTQTYLDMKTAEILGKPEGARATLAKQLWRSAKGTAAFGVIKRKLRRMATGRERCMYCEDSSGASIDHFWPLARYPLRAFRWKNYLYACAWCNSHEKRDQFPISWVSRKPLLIDPTIDDPMDHLVLDRHTGRFEARDGSSKGRPTIHVFGLNRRPDLPEGRRDAFKTLELLLGYYAELAARGNVVEASVIKAHVQKRPFSSVFAHLLETASSPASTVIHPACLAALRAYPEIRGWL